MKGPGLLCREESSRSAALIETYIPGLRRFALALFRGDRECADDLVQDTLERALSHWHQRRSSGDPRGWIYTILYNRFLSDHSRLRRQASYNASTESLDDECECVDGGQELAIVLRDLVRGFAALPAEQRAVLLLVGVEDFSYADTARLLGVPVGTVMSRLSRGRERLRQYLSGGSGQQATAARKRMRASRMDPYRPSLEESHDLDTRNS